MFHNIIGYANILFMCIVGYGYFWISKKKKHGNETKKNLEILQSTIDDQQACINLMAVVTSSNADLFRVISDLIANEKMSIAGNVSDMSRIFKEVSYKFYAHLTGNDSDYIYFFLKHECFNDTNNCINALSKVLKNAGISSVADEIQDYIIQMR